MCTSKVDTRGCVSSMLAVDRPWLSHIIKAFRHGPTSLPAQEKGEKSKGSEEENGGGESTFTGSVIAAERQKEKEMMLDDGGRTCTGVLTSRPTSR